MFLNKVFRRLVEPAFLKRFQMSLLIGTGQKFLKNKSHSGKLTYSHYFQLFSTSYIIAISGRQWQTTANVSNQLLPRNAVLCFSTQVKVKAMWESTLGTIWGAVLYCDLSPDHIYAVSRLVSHVVSYAQGFYLMISLKY